MEDAANKFGAFALPLLEDDFKDKGFSVFEPDTKRFTHPGLVCQSEIGRASDACGIRMILFGMESALAGGVCRGDCRDNSTRKQLARRLQPGLRNSRRPELFLRNVDRGEKPLETVQRLVFFWIQNLAEVDDCLRNTFYGTWQGRPAG